MTKSFDDLDFFRWFKIGSEPYLNKIFDLRIFVREYLFLKDRFKNFIVFHINLVGKR